MSRVYEALWKSEQQHLPPDSCATAPETPEEVIQRAVAEPAELHGAGTFQLHPSPDQLLVAVTDEESLGAEKFRVLGARINNLRSQREIKTLLITSGGPGEGKTLVAANLAVILAKRTNQKVLLIEGDLRRPAFERLFGVGPLRGLTHWWKSSKDSVCHYLYRAAPLPLWILSAGGPAEQPIQILQSKRLTELMGELAGWFDWIIIDSPPLLPLADPNLWARLADGTLLVVRENNTSRKTLEKGLESLDDPKLIGVVLNEAMEVTKSDYYNSYYGTARKAEGNGNSKQKSGV